MLRSFVTASGIVLCLMPLNLFAKDAEERVGIQPVTVIGQPVGLGSGDALAHEPDDDILTLPEVMVEGLRPAESASQQTIIQQEIERQPPGRPGDLLRLVPGVVTFNATGGPGKADNFLLRGFDADHGTDVAGFLDGMPLNLRSHAHGQGYLDLNFLIPETIKAIEVQKGPYQVQYGDFATAGAVNFTTRDVVEEGVVQVVGGQFGTQRNLLMFSPTHDRIRSLVAAETSYTNGPFLDPNRSLRFNGLVKVTMNPTPRSELSLTGTEYTSRWNAPGEIPMRAVEAGQLDRFGSIDPSQGGRTQRTTGNLRYHYDTFSGGTAFAESYLQYYRLDLFSNPTGFLNDPVNGDGIEQADRRYVYGGQVGYRQHGELLGVASAATLGVQTRVDDAHVRLGTQLNRQPLSTTTDSTIVEASYSPYLKLEFQPLSWARLTGGARADVFTFNVTDRCGPNCTQRPSGRTQDVIPSLKGNLILGPWVGTEFFLNAGTGFHSNDARAVVSNPTIQALPRATAYEVGLRTQQWERVESFVSLWVMDLSSELVFSGEHATTDIKGATRRYGVEFGGRLRLWDWLTLGGDATFTHAAFRGTGLAIPQAPLMTARSEVTVRLAEGLSSSLQMFHVGSRPLTEDRSVTAQPFTIVSLMTKYRPVSKGWWHRLEGFVSIQNLLNTPWRQNQLYYQSRLATEPAPVGDIHFVSGLPRMVMGGVSWYF